jgi:hypothetical protein
MEIISHGEQKKVVTAYHKKTTKKKRKKSLGTHTEKSTRVQPRKKMIDAH